MTFNTIGFIGLGNMGLPMATNLAGSGHTIKGFDPQLISDGTRVPAGITLQSSINDAVAQSDLIILMLPNGEIVIDVLKQIIAAGAQPDAIVDCSTIDINDAREAHALASSAGIGFLDSPVSGGISGAAAGTLTTMVGGSSTLLEAIKPALSAVFNNFVYCGDGGAGQAAKICNNMLLATSMIGASESFNLGRKLGLDLETLYQVLASSTGSCWSVSSYCPVPGIGPQTPADNNYTPGFSSQMMLKDMNLTQAAAGSVNQATPLAAHALALYEDYVAAGGGPEDFSGIIRYLDGLAR